jgi:HPt (histidine-containing phosphotransfer) domain-containing protein
MAAKPYLSRLRHQRTIFRFERLHDVSAGDPACEHALLQSLLRDTATSVTRIGAAFAEANATQIAALAHSLLGACETVGAVSLANFCRDLETKAKSPSLPPAHETLARFQHEYERLRDVTGDYMESRAKHAPSLLEKPRV